MQESIEGHNLIYADASFIILSKFIFFSASTFIYHRQFHNKKDRVMMAIEYLATNGLVYQPSDKVRFFKGVHTSYAMLPPDHVKDKELPIKALAKLNLNIDDYVRIWQQCLLPTPELSAKLEKMAINHIRSYLKDYISIIHRLGNAMDPVAQEILKPGLLTGQIGIDFDSKLFSLAPEHMIHLNNDHDVVKQLSGLCSRVDNETVDVSDKIGFSMVDHPCILATMPGVTEASTKHANDYNQLQIQGSSSVISLDISLNIHNPTNTPPKQVGSIEESKRYFMPIHFFISQFNCISFTIDTIFITTDIDSNSFDDCVFVLEKIKASKTCGQ